MGQATLERIAGAMLSARAALKAEYEKLRKAVLAIVRDDEVCRRLMTVPTLVRWWRSPTNPQWTNPSRIAKSKAAERFRAHPKEVPSREKKT